MMHRPTQNETATPSWPGLRPGPAFPCVRVVMCLCVAAALAGCGRKPDAEPAAEPAPPPPPPVVASEAPDVQPAVAPEAPAEEPRRPVEVPGIEGDGNNLMRSRAADKGHTAALRDVEMRRNELTQERLRLAEDLASRREALLKEQAELAALADEARALAERGQEKQRELERRITADPEFAELQSALEAAETAAVALQQKARDLVRTRMQDQFNERHRQRDSAAFPRPPPPSRGVRPAPEGALGAPSPAPQEPSE